MPTNGTPLLYLHGINELEVCYEEDRFRKLEDIIHVHKFHVTFIYLLISLPAAPPEKVVRFFIAVIFIKKNVEMYKNIKKYIKHYIFIYKGLENTIKIYNFTSSNKKQNINE